MVAEPPPARSAYRNTAVFRSAERLAASVPAKPARQRPPRAAVFIGGLVCGLALAFLLVPRLRETWVPAPLATERAGQPRTTTGVLSPVKPSPAPGAIATPGAAPAVTPLPTGAVAATDAPPASAVPASNLPPAAAAPARASSPASVAAPAAGVHSPGLAQWPSRLQLTGTLQTPGLPNLAVDIDVHVTSTESLAAYFEGTIHVRSSVLRAAPFKVVGTFNGEAILLGNPAEFSSTSACSFVIDFPPKNGRFTGTWSLDGRKGVLAVRSHPAVAKAP